MEIQTKYFVVPIPLIKGILTGEKGIKECIQEIVAYSLYSHTKYLPFGIEDEDDEKDANNPTTQIKSSAKFLNVKLGSAEQTIRNGDILFKKFYGKYSYCGIRTNTIWDYDSTSKTERQIAQFCAFCATRSILGKGRYKKTNTKLIIARMFGYNTIDEFNADTPKIVKNISKAERERRLHILEYREKYAKRYHIDKILTDLEINWGLKRYADNIRGMYISYEFSLQELAKLCEENKRSVQKCRLKEEKRKAKELVKNTAP